MKIATTQNGKPVMATANSPKQAICPDCGGVLTLRSRQPMKNGTVVYYWRHQSNENRHCKARTRPFAMKTGTVRPVHGRLPDRHWSPFLCPLPATNDKG